MTQGRREDKCPSARAGKRPRAGGAERGRAHAPPLSLRGRSDGGFCLFRPVICLLLMMWLFLLLRKRLARTVLIFTERSDQLSRATDRVPGLPANPGYAQ
ncbi:hypothetical protein OSK09_25505 [Escherichia coli]|nr:hypothetical protein [Escherichia coli]